MADEKDNADKTDKNEDLFDDESLDAFSDEDDEDEKEKEDDDEGDDSAGKDDKSKKPEKKSSAVIQKQKYREKLEKALDRIAELESKKDEQGVLTDEQKKEKAAEEFLVKKIRDVLKVDETERARRESKEEEAFQDELDLVLEDNTDLKEKQVLDVCEELEVSPAQAVKIIKREMKLKGLKKPDTPQPKRGSPEVEDKGKDGAKKRMSLDEINRSIKEQIRAGKL